MTRYMNYSTDYQIDRIIPDAGNMQVGIPMRKKAIAIDDGVICILGPSIELFHPSEYNPLKYRCYNGSTYETFKYGVAGLYNVTPGNSGWITTYISDIDSKGSTIYLSTLSEAAKDDELIIYYYARVNRYGGYKHTLSPGDDVIPEMYDTFQRVLNEAIPVEFGVETRSTDQANWPWDAQALYQNNNSITSDTWNDILTRDSWTSVSNFNFPLFVTDMRVIIQFPEADVTDKYPDVPLYLYFRLTVDDKPLLRGFGTTSDSNYQRYSKMDVLSDSYVAGTSPGAAYSSATDKPGLKFLTKKIQIIEGNTDNTKIAFDWNFGELEVLHDLKLEIYPDDTVTETDTYVRGYYADTS